ncbi:MAG: aminodeoxychorismate synthase component I [Candidatus Omnitrophica bacterium]|nr:aminodeoxychorismate synthase component I [Candidatus Omnitrophota bacterium]
MFKLPKDNFVFLETNRFDKDNRRSYLFSNPVKIIACYKPEDIGSAFLELEACISKGYYAAGFISYEAGFSFEENLKGLGKKSFFPLMWFGVYKKPAIFTHREKMDLLQRKNLHYALENLRPSIAREEYIDNIEKIKDFIRRGDTYQVNYTFKYKFNFSGSAFDFYEDLKARQSVSYSALIKTRDYSLLSLSPELFFRKNKDRIEVRPMKGTIDRGRNLEADRLNAQILKNSLKNRSENVMIVDLLRNDLGRISRAGTVRTKKLFEVERYETLFQMTSVVRSVLKKDIALYDLFRAIFPSGSVTGAPKISTMKIINSLETEPRGVYTGGVGFFAPKGEAVFNVAIRTVLIDNKTRKAEMGIGSGIVYDSDPNKEFDECKLKADFITRKKTDFKLIETMLWRPEKGYFLLGLHLGRVLSSAEYFNFRCDRKVIIKKLKGLERKFKRGHGYRVRLLLNRDGKVELSFARINKILEPAKAGFSDKKTSSVDIFLYHKTTNRELYNEEYKRWRNKGYFDIIFTNEKNQVTEGAISNIIIKKGRFFYTPPLECGLLNGVFRKRLLKNRRFPVKERILYKDDIKKADEIYMANSVRGMVRVKL